MISAEGIRRYTAGLLAAQPVYIWGADGEVMTKEFLTELKRRFGEEHYKDIQIDEVEGRFGMDCSGMLTQISGMNRTADAYYRECKEKGPVKLLPKNKICLVFRKEGTKVVHLAIYMGDDTTVEMWNGCEKKKFNADNWTYYGEPEWIVQQRDEIKAGDQIRTDRLLRGYNTAADALAKRNLRTNLQPGVFYVYKVFGQSANITKTFGVPGSWVVL